MSACWLVALIFALSGCAGITIQPPASALSTTAHAAAAAPRDTVRDGRALQREGDGGQASGQFRYAESPARRTLSLFSPLGNGAGRGGGRGRNGDAHRCQRWTSGSPSVAELLRPIIDLPDSGCRTVRLAAGLPAANPPSTAVERDAAGWPRRFRQAGGTLKLAHDRPNLARQGGCAGAFVGAAGY